ncbi:efflux RND transporter permease subunit [Solimonas marina]|uniref:Efflux pump membrane transporter n=1 Tax=Solimonas marina TaxID=2714601 RepID=A0A969W8C5_9GAMM|nr:efflux RND transporter permease subunit [Solimonas marina]NKF20821.1 efflux RND transporter permease subunit [Solimonas marina]
MVNYFIDRPIFAWVLAIVVMLFGGISILSLPIAQYPAIAPPAVSITVSYPGASAETVRNTVTQVIEQQLSGIDHLMYFSSESDKDGSMTITLNFEQGTDPDIAQVQVQNKLQLAMSQLPTVVQQQGVTVAKATKNFLMVVGFYSDDGSMTRDDIADYIVSSVQDPISRTEGVGDFQVFGTSYAMRIWLDPDRLNAYGLTPVDVKNAISAQNVQVAAGELGGLPAVKGQQLNATIIGPSRLTSVKEFRNILLKVQQDGSQVRLQDVADVELGGETDAFNPLFNGKPAGGIAIKLASGANALDTAEAVRQTIDDLRPNLPKGLKVVYPYDTTPFIKISIEEVVKTLFEAIVLVFLVMYLFLQNLRATLIPTIAVPVVLLGTFGILSVAGYSINTLTMFGMVLAIGLLVDDAIVVVENVERVMTEEKLSPKEATRKSMGQITGALIGIALVLSAVFVPMAFFSGSTGVIYRQFSVTIVSAMALSVIVALIFTPSLCATLLKPVDHEQHGRHGFFGWFNRVFTAGNRRYERGVRHVIGRSGRYLLIYGVIVVAMAVLFLRIPTAFLPEEDQGMIMVQVTTPVGATRDRTDAALNAVREYVMTKEADSVESMFTVSGFNFSGRGQNSGMGFIRLKDWSERGSAKQHATAVVGRIMGRFMGYKDAQIFALIPPAVPELGMADGFDLQLQDKGNLGHEKLYAARNQLLGMASKDPKLALVRPNGLNDEPQFKLDVDWEKAAALGVSISDITDTIGATWGQSYVNQFIDRGRVKRVYLQGAAEARMQPQDIGKWYVRNSSGSMVPMSAFMTGNWVYGSPKLESYNGLSSYEIMGMPAEGVSSGQAMAEMEKLAAKLPAGIGYSWTGMSYEEQKSGSQTPALYTISLIVVFLCLAALYESWSIPASVMLVVPLGIIGTVLATLVRGLSNDVYFQIGMLTTVGLAAKNAILIVEFAKENYESGMGLVDATIQAAHQRLRPILMTSLAFILGVLPLALSSGAGSGSQNAIGTGVIGGMLSATILAIFFVPVFFVVVRKWAERDKVRLESSAEHAQRPEH